MMAITTGYRQRIKIDKLISMYKIAKYNAAIMPNANKPLTIDINIKDLGMKNELRVIISKLISKISPITPLVTIKVIRPAPSDIANLAELGKIATLIDANNIKTIPINSSLILRFISFQSKNRPLKRGPKIIYVI